MCSLDLSFCVYLSVCLFVCSKCQFCPQIPQSRWIPSANSAFLEEHNFLTIRTFFNRPKFCRREGSSCPAPLPTMTLLLMEGWHCSSITDRNRMWLTKCQCVRELRLTEAIHEPHICENILHYNVHAERKGSLRYAKGMSETMQTLHGLVYVLSHVSRTSHIFWDVC